MIQRIQSVYLALVISLSCIMFFVPLSVFIPNTNTSSFSQPNEFTYKLNVYELSRISSGNAVRVSVSYPMLLLNFSVGALAVFALFLFKNRKKQILVCRINILFICLLAGLIFWTEDSVKTSLAANITYLIGTYIPVAQLIMTYLAERAIKKDDDLVKSADRLR